MEIENILALVIALASFGAVAYSGFRLYKLYRFHKQRADDLELKAKYDTQSERTAMQEAERARALAKDRATRLNLNPPSRELEPSYNRLRELSGQRPLPSTNQVAGTRTTVPTPDTGPDLLTTMLVLDMLNNNHETVKHGVDRDTGQVYNYETTPAPSNSSSWGLDDDDSRKSASSSFSSSDSSSSWSSSDSSSSSSDSGPSSDW